MLTSFNDNPRFRRLRRHPASSESALAIAHARISLGFAEVIYCQIGDDFSKLIARL